MCEGGGRGCGVGRVGMGVIGARAVGLGLVGCPLCATQSRNTWWILQIPYEWQILQVAGTAVFSSAGPSEFWPLEL